MSNESSALIWLQIHSSYIYVGTVQISKRALNYNRRPGTSAKYVLFFNIKFIYFTKFFLRNNFISTNLIIVTKV